MILPASNNKSLSVYALSTVFYRIYFSLHASYGKEDAPGVWCPRIYDDKRFIILNLFSSWMQVVVETNAPAPKKYWLGIFPVSALVAIGDNAEITKNARDIVVKERMKISEEMIDEILKAAKLPDGDFMMKKAAMVG
jgi:hypothetical protein